MKKILDPVTPEEWQTVVNAAQFLLELDSARQYGLIEGGPSINVARCERMLARGRKLGYEPKEWTPDE